MPVHNIGTLQKSSGPWWLCTEIGTGQAVEFCLYETVLGVGRETRLITQACTACSQHSGAGLYEAEDCQVQDSEKPSSGVVIGNRVQSLRPADSTPRQMPRGQGREATIPTRCRIIWPDRSATHTSSRPLNGLVGRGRWRQNMGFPSPHLAYVSMTSSLPEMW